MRSGRWLVPILAVVLVLAPVGAAAAPVVATGNEMADVMRVSGAGSGRLGPEWGSYGGDPVSFQVDGRAIDPLRPAGTFHVVHRKPDGRLVADFRGRLTSLEAVGDVAVVTGVIDAAEHPGVPLELVGKPVSLTVYDGGALDRIGWMWGFFGAPVALRQGAAPILALTDSGFTVHGAGAVVGSAGAVVPTSPGGTSVLAAVNDPGVRLRLAARIPAGGTPKDVDGNFRLAGRAAGTGYVEGRIDCLAVGGPVAIATGVVTASDDAAVVGRPVSFMLEDGPVDRVGWLRSWSADRPAIVDCRSAVPFHAVHRGGLVVRAAENRSLR